MTGSKFGNMRLKYVCDILDEKRKPIPANQRNQDADVLYDYYGASGRIDTIDGFTIDDHVMLVGEDGANLKLRNLPLVYEVTGKAWINNHAHILKPKTENCFRFVFHAIENEDINSFITGSAQPKLSQENLKNIQIPHPSYDEQHRIANFLDKKCAEIDSLAADVQKEIETLQEYRRSLITEAVTKGLNPDFEMKDSGNIYLGQINSQWEAKRIKYLFSIRKDIAGYEGPTVLSITQRGIRPKNLAYGEGQQAADYSGYQLVSPGDFAMNHMDLLTGWVDISNQSGVTSPDYRVFRLRDEEQNNRRYFLYVMQMCYTNKIFYQLGHGVSGMGRWRLPTDRFLNFIVPVPSRIEQKRIATFLDEKCYEIDSIIDTKQKQLDTLVEYRKSIIYEYITGKKEVV